MKFLTTVWARLFPKPDYPTSDSEIIALIKGELEKRNLQADLWATELSLGYVRDLGTERMVAYYLRGDLCFAVFMDNTIKVYQKDQAQKIVVSSGIDLSLDKDHQMEDSYHCWGIFVNAGHFRIDRFRKD